MQYFEKDALLLKLNNKYGNMDRLFKTESTISAVYCGSLNKSYYEPSQGFAYCILVTNIGNMRNKQTKMKETGSLTLAMGKKLPS